MNVFLMETDVGQLVSAIGMQELILWDIDTDIEILQTAINEQREQHKEAMGLMRQGMAELSAEVELLSQHIVRLNSNVGILTADQHPPGFCRDRFCKAECNARLKELEAGTVKLIDNRFPEEKLKRLGFS